MSATKPNKLAAVTLPVILQRCAFPPEILEAIAGLSAVEAVVGKLAAGGQGMEAARVLAHALPKREAVWWACMCAIHTADAKVADTDRKTRELAETWVRQPTAELARAAMEEAKRSGFQSPEAWTGVAAFWSGESLTPPNTPAVAPPPHLTGVAVAGAVALAAVRNDAARQKQRLALFLQSAQDIAAGGSGRLAPEAA
jgi:hypothetical protein